MPKPTADRRLMAMRAYLGGNFGTSGCKWYGSNIANREKGLPRSIFMFTLTDTDKGAPLAFMSANLLSAYRAGAVPGVGAKYLAKKDSRVPAILGPGVMGKTTLAAFTAPAAGQLAADLVMDNTPLVDPSPYRFDRFSALQALLM